MKLAQINISFKISKIYDVGNIWRKTFLPVRNLIPAAEIADQIGINSAWPVNLWQAGDAIS